jgi:uncharacterized protein YdeI (YjbR/CyaY-like superfamily)
MSEKNHKVDFYFRNSKKWRPELETLREIVLDTPLTEELKWGVPCYTYQNKNVVLIHEFKEYCGILFVKGALLKDEQAILIQQTENVQAGRQIRFTKVQEILAIESSLKEYLAEAIEIEKAGLKVTFKQAVEFPVADEFQKQLDENPELSTAFYALTPGRQRAYLLFFSAPKQSKTREARVEKSAQQILDGKGLND